jgi:hypothetical protein
MTAHIASSRNRFTRTILFTAHTMRRVVACSTQAMKVEQGDDCDVDFFLVGGQLCEREKMIL